jgi:hypothetical protein
MPNSTLVVREYSFGMVSACAYTPPESSARNDDGKRSIPELERATLLNSLGRYT